MRRPRSSGYFLLLLSALAAGCERETPGPDLTGPLDPGSAAEGTPTFRNKSAETLPPYTHITYGPQNSQTWWPDVEFRWEGLDDDGVVVSYEYMWTNDEQFNWEFGEGPVQFLPDLIAWIDTLTYRPDGPGHYSDERIWKETEADSVVFLDMPDGANYYFAVRAFDNYGEKEATLEVNENVRVFAVSANQDGPRLFITSNIAGTWRSGEVVEERDVFLGEGFHFNWSAKPGPTGTPVMGYSYAEEDTANWTPFSLETIEFPAQIPGEPEELWIPSTVPGVTRFFVRAIDAPGFVRTLAATLRVFSGPRECPPPERYILAVLDTDPTAIQSNNIWVPDYRKIERGLVEFLLEGYNFQIHETHGWQEPSLSQMDCASTTFWLHSADPSNLDSSVMVDFHRSRPNSNQPVLFNLLPSYIQSGGNFLLCGIQPVNALRFIEDLDEGPQEVLQFPVDFCHTLEDTTLVPHWAATILGVCRIQNSITQASDLPVLSLARSQITTGLNPYPDLPFDPLSIPHGTKQDGFHYFDTGIEPTDDAEVIYRDVATGESVGIRKLTAPGTIGNTIYLGFHPYFIQKSTFRSFLQAAFTDFGEVPVP